MAILYHKFTKPASSCNIPFALPHSYMNRQCLRPDSRVRSNKLNPPGAGPFPPAHTISQSTSTFHNPEKRVRARRARILPRPGLPPASRNPARRRLSGRPLSPVSSTPPCVADSAVFQHGALDFDFERKAPLLAAVAVRDFHAPPEHGPGSVLGDFNHHPDRLYAVRRDLAFLRSYAVCLERGLRVPPQPSRLDGLRFFIDCLRIGDRV